MNAIQPQAPLIVEQGSCQDELYHVAPPIALALNPDIDRETLARDYAASGRVRVYDLLAEGAVELHDHLRAREDWIQVIHAPDMPMEFDRVQRQALGRDGYAPVDREVYERGRHGFQYRYEALRVPDVDEPQQDGDLLGPLASFLHDEAMLTLISDITGRRPDLFINGQATCYDSGDFLTGHDDDVVGENRMAAFVLGLTQRWRLEWGGLLLFHGERERTAEALAPRFNTLDLFRVPQQHSVSLVSPSAAFPRMAVTGWYRAADDS